MKRPPVGIVIQGLLSPALLEGHSIDQRHLPSHHSGAGVDHTGTTGSILEDKQVDSNTTDADGQEHSLEDVPSSAEELGKNGSPRSGKSFYKLEMINIQLLSVHGHPVCFQDFSMLLKIPLYLLIMTLEVISLCGRVMCFHHTYIQIFTF